MPRYRFTGDHETVLTGLTHGVNARLHRAGHDQPDESTLVAQPGDEVTTDEVYDHPLLELVDGRRTAQGAARAKAAKKPAKKTTARRPAAKADPEPDDDAETDEPAPDPELDATADTPTEDQEQPR